jgi:hypothetical protein
MYNVTSKTAVGFVSNEGDVKGLISDAVTFMRGYNAFMKVYNIVEEARDYNGFASLYADDEKFSNFIDALAVAREFAELANSNGLEGEDVDGVNTLIEQAESLIKCIICAIMLTKVEKNVA